MRVAHAVSALVDTGSPFTTVSPRDALSFGLPIKNWTKGETCDLAGFKFYRHPLEGTLSFRDSQSGLVHYRSGITVLVPTKLDRDTLTRIQTIPSLIGTDFIEDNGLALVFDPLANTAYFEKQDAPQTTATNQSGTAQPNN